MSKADPTIASTRRQRLRDWIDLHYEGVQAAFVASTGINQGELSALLRDKSFGEQKARKLEQQAKMPARFLDGLDQEDAVAVARSEIRAGYVRFQLMDATGGAGPGMINPEYPEVLREVELAEWQVREELGRVPSPHRVKLLTVRGDSMSPRIRSGDVVFVDIEDHQPYDGGLFVIVLHGHALVKRLEIRTDGLHIVSLAAPERPDILPPNKMDSLHIAGRVLGAIQLRKSEDL